MFYLMSAATNVAEYIYIVSMNSSTHPLIHSYSQTVPHTAFTSNPVRLNLRSGPLI